MRKSAFPLAILLLVLGLVLCACSATVAFAVVRVVLRVDRFDLPQMPPVLRAPEATPEPRAKPGAAPEAAPQLSAVGQGRLLVQAADGNIYTVRPDGADRVDLTSDADSMHIYRQPAWSPDGARVAWVEIVASESVLKSALLTGQATGMNLSRVDLAQYAPFYLSWSPDSRSVAALSSWDQGLALRTVDVTAGGAAVSLVGQGQPLYFSWSPDGQSLVAHLDGQRLSVLSALDGAQDDLAGPTAAFGAPQWSSNGSSLVYARRSNGQQQLVVAGTGGAVQHEVATIDGSVSFSLSPDSQQIAFIDTLAEVETAALGRLYMSRIGGGQPAVIDEGPVVAFFWSPDGARLAYLTPGDRPGEGPRASALRTLEAANNRLWLRWRVWDGERSIGLSRFLPSDTFLVEYLRFFDQYARSMTPWSPDGQAIVYAGESEDGVPGVWVQPVDETAPATRVGDGVYAAWSPQ